MSSRAVIDENGMETINVIARPYVEHLFERLHPFYEFVVFTAAQRDYAEEVVKFLDPERRFITSILCSEDCIELPCGDRIKDLRAIGDRDLSSILIVDNSIINFAFQFENGIPITPFVGDENDQELLFLTNYLIKLFVSEKLVEENGKKVGLVKARDAIDDGRKLLAINS